ncbi:MAG: alpha/beta hydrolase [Gemmatimonadales bacterium]
MARDPHRDQPIIVWGAPLAAAPAALILVHGRGSAPGDMQALARELDRPQFACLAPAAAGGTWYPYSFLERIERNEPHLSSALRLLGTALGKVEAAGLAGERVALLGFSQGACLTLEFAARHARRYGAVIGFSGGLIGPEGTPRDYAGSFEGTPVFLGSSDVDPHVPKRRVDETDAVFTRLGAQVTKRIYSGMGHTVSADEIAQARVLLDAVLASAAAR